MRSAGKISPGCVTIIKIRIHNAEEFHCLLLVLVDELIDAQIHFALYQIGS